MSECRLVKSGTSSPEEEFMFGLGMPELIIIMVIFLIVFGAGKLPEIGAGMGKAIKNFKDSTSEIEQK
jgi:sec-independent protein translocase protein TatA